MTDKTTAAPSHWKGSRSAARLGAVQAIYQIDATGVGREAVITEFLEHRLGREVDGDRYKDADVVFFADLVRGVLGRLDEIDRAMAAALDKNWPIERLEAIMKAMLRTATYELLARPDVPTKVVIGEYIDVAHGFYAGTEPGFVNGVLDREARTLRGDELGGEDDRQ